ncbi:DUF4399 domain-containing protein [uncultured Roseibium sp.]|uniref:DUF4399 domain-containing protein n=1 Tax=uncultured Roseibium sp. TaxID=1936171 RepID=UPI002639BA59|nr:DUF4399 domain-containing protein [uncultured Roseibium sp.]
MKTVFASAAIALSLACTQTLAGETPSSPDAKVYFVNIEDGATIKGPVKVVFGLTGMGIAPAGIEKDNTGHHHLLINRAPIGQGEDGEDEFVYNIPADENHIHYGGGQTETVLELAPGEHTLQLVLGDLNHIPHNPPVYSDVIKITVE